MNKHASGITAIFEALLYGKPTICTDIGGLRAYFGDEHVYFADPTKPNAILAQVCAVLADPELARRKTAAAQAVIVNEINSRTFARDHVEISRRLLGRG
jgi:glycosyltransferase involved in cell wall biosynthesis